MQELLEKLANKQRLNYDEGVKLWNLDLFSLGQTANKIREQKHGKKVFFNVNRHINPSNLCADTCKFCAFSAHRKNENAYTMSFDEIMSVARDAANRGIKELHIVSSHNPFTKPEQTFKVFRQIKSEFPHIHIKAMTAAEVDYMSRKFKLSYEEVIDEMIASGVDSMPGGGAEIFDEGVRRELCAGKVSSQNWLKIHSLWHERGRQSNATMLFGHIESKAMRIDHMLRLRAVQDESLKRANGGYFNAFIPLVYQRDNNYLKDIAFLGSAQILSTIAISRILLDNIEHIKAYWATSTMNLAMVAQDFGADDMDGTIENESIQSAAGADSKRGRAKSDFIEMIQTSGLIPVERDSLYNELASY